MGSPAVGPAQPDTARSTHTQTPAADSGDRSRPGHGSSWAPATALQLHHKPTWEKQRCRALPKCAKCVPEATAARKGLGRSGALPAWEPALS